MTEPCDLCYDEFLKGKQAQLKKDLEFIEWLLETKGKGYTKEYYIQMLEYRREKLKQSLKNSDTEMKR